MTSPGARAGSNYVKRREERALARDTAHGAVSRCAVSASCFPDEEGDGRVQRHRLEGADGRNGEGERSRLGRAIALPADDLQVDHQRFCATTMISGEPSRS